jgi:hypothetical protein
LAAFFIGAGQEAEITGSNPVSGIFLLVRGKRYRHGFDSRWGHNRKNANRKSAKNEYAKTPKLILAIWQILVIWRYLAI